MGTKSGEQGGNSELQSDRGELKLGSKSQMPVRISRFNRTGGN